ncbi:MAG TPA: hypothetical protein DG753_03950, partial [Clostridium sp.]|nr:hypothetical protein [Clostridium sp.]
MVSVNKLYAKYIFILAAVMVVNIFNGCSNTNNTSNIDISNVVEEAFVTEDGYSDELSKHMSEDVFKKINVFNTYAVNNPEYVKPVNVNFSLKEFSRESRYNTIYVNMIYSVFITDSQDNSIGGSSNI